MKNETITAKKIKKGTITGAQIKEGSITSTTIDVSTLATVPSAQTATTATTAQSASTAQNATNAQTAKSATTAGEAKHADEADTAKHADEADNANHAGEADTATHATEADFATAATHATSADDAGTLEGRTAGDLTLSCRTGTKFYGGMCWDENTREPEGWLSAVETCGNEGGRLPSIDELIAYVRQPGPQVIGPNWSGDVVGLDGSEEEVLTSDETSRGPSKTGLFRYRCVFPQSN